jgi:diguanylate cyclase (GGDEF)-like protein/PAS domain S-box-containing protein
LKYAETAIYRATAESVVAASIVIFLYAYLKARFWHSFIRLLFLGWIGLQFAIVALAVIDPRLASMLARASLVLGAGVGTVTLVVLMLWGQDRAFALVPMWILYLVWLFGAGVVVGGRLSGDAVVMALNGGMVMLMLILAFTVTQFAFRGGDLLYGGSPSALQLRSLAIDNSASAVWEWNSRRDEIAVTRNLEEALGLAEGALSRSVDRFLDNVHAQDRDRLRLQLIAAREKNGGHIHAEFRMRAADGTYRWFELQAADVPSSDHRHLRYAGLVRDITDSKRSLERLVHDGVKDSLTGLPNRELFVDRLDVAIKLCRHEGRAAPVVLCIGIDRFGSVNREHGTMVGDTMLLTIGRRLERFVAPNDTVARIGGDEFAILISEVQDPAKIQHISDHIRRSMRAPLRLSGRDLVLSGAIGIAGYDGQQRDGAQLLREAESAMFKAKQRGPGQAEVFKADMRSEQDDRAAIESELRRALERRQVRVFYQPIIRQPDGVLAGFEALVRWHHPRLGVLNPDDFVPIAESSDLIVRLGSYVLERAVSDLARWQRELPRSESPLFVSVNISSRQLFRQDLVAELRRIVGRDETPRGTIVLEITESVLMENAEQAAEILKSLHGTGATLALDDFGTGFSALGYLHRYTFDLIKIDRSLLQAGSAEGSGRTIVNAIVALGHELGKKVIAEGVESDEDETFLRSVGCDMTQGFLYSDAISGSDVIELLRDLRRSERSERSWFRKRKASKSRPEDGAGVTTRPQEPPPAPPLPLAVVPPPPPPPMQAPPQPMTPPVAAFAPPDPSSRPPTAGARSLGQPPVRPGYQPNGPVAPPPPPTGVPHGYDAMPSAAAPPQAAPLPSGFPSVSPAQHGGAPGLSPSSAPGHGAPNGADWPPMPTRGPPPAQPAPSRALPPRWPDGPPQRSAGDEPVPEAPSQHATQRPPRKS